MHRTPLLIVLALGFWSALACAGQTTSTAIPEALRTHVSGEQFQIVTSIRGLPLGVRDELQSMWGTPTLDIADPGDEYQSTGAPGTPTRPTRRLIAAGCSADHHCLVYYERGGPARTWLAALFHWTPDATRFEWGGMAPAGLQSVEDVRKAMLAGVIRPANGRW